MTGENAFAQLARRGQRGAAPTAAASARNAAGAAGDNAFIRLMLGDDPEPAPLGPSASLGFSQAARSGLRSATALQTVGERTGLNADDAARVDGLLRATGQPDAPFEAFLRTEDRERLEFAKIVNVSEELAQFRGMFDDTRAASLAQDDLAVVAGVGNLAKSFRFGVERALIGAGPGGERDRFARAAQAMADRDKDIGEIFGEEVAKETPAEGEIINPLTGETSGVSQDLFTRLGTAVRTLSRVAGARLLPKDDGTARLPPSLFSTRDSVLPQAETVTPEEAERGIETTTRRINDNLERARENNRLTRGAERRRAEFNRRIAGAETLGGAAIKFLQAAADDPLQTMEAFFYITAESAPSLAAFAATRFAAAAAGGPAGLGLVAGATASGVVSRDTERAAGGQELAQELGIDLSDPAQIDADKLRQLTQAVGRRAAVIALMDAFTAGVSGRIPGKTALARATAEAAVDAVGGAAGEALGARAAGSRAAPEDVLLEGLVGLFTSPAELGAAAVADRRSSERARERRRVDAERKVFDTLADRSKQSKLRGRSRELFQKMVDQGLADTEIESVHVRARGVLGAFESAQQQPAEGEATDTGSPDVGDLTLDEFLDALPEGTAERFQQAIESDGTVAIPTAVFASDVIGSKIEKVFRDNATFSPDGLTAAEARAQDAEIEALVERFTREQENTAETGADDSFEARQFRALRGQIRSAGRSAEEADRTAALQTARIRTLAQEMNVPFEAVAEQFPITVRAADADTDGDTALAGADVERLLDEVRSPGVTPTAAAMRMRAALVEEGLDPFTVSPVEAEAALLRRLDTLPRLAEARAAQPAQSRPREGSPTTPEGTNPELRPEIVFGRDLEGTGLETEEFFADVSAGTRQQPQNLDQYTPAFQVTEGVAEFQRTWETFAGNFDDHIKTSIPGYREMQDSVGWTIREFLDSAGGGSVLDIGASEGAMVKAIASTAQSDISAIALDPNTQMRDTFNEKPQVDGVEFSLTAFGTAEQEGQFAWEASNGENITFFDPEGRTFDVVHESMVFQFISNARGAQIRRAKELMKPDGLLIIAEKVSDANPEVFLENEVAKDEYKSRHFDSGQLERKRQEVLRAGDAVEGMTAKLATRQEAEALLALHFDNVVQHWDSGNFKGWVASDSAENLQSFVSRAPDMNSEFSTVETPREVTTEEALPGSAFRSALLAGMELSPEDTAVAQRRGLSLSQRIDRTVTIPDTPDFEAFLADSKIRDEDGNPLGLWHGTGEAFEVFDPARGAQRFGDKGAGFFFTTRRGTAVEAALRGGKPRLLKGVARATNPAVFTTTNPDPSNFWLENASRVTAAVEERDADAVMIRSPNETLVVLFESGQFKSVEDRQGEVDAASPNIFQQGELDLPVTRADFEGQPSAAAFRRPGWFVITGTQEQQGPFSSTANVESQRQVRAALTARGLDFMEVRGVYQGVDDGPAFLVFGDEAQAPALGEQFGRDSVLTREGLVFPDGRPTVPVTGVRFGDDAQAQDFHTVLPNGVVWALDLDFSAQQEGLTLNQADIERLTGFQSGLATKVAGAKQKRAPAKDWTAILKKLPGVSKQELDWTGVLAWLSTQEGQVDRTAVVDFLHANQPDLVEVRLTGEGEAAPDTDARFFEGDFVPVDENFVNERAEDLLDDAREAIADEEGVDPGEVDDDEVRDRARDMAREELESDEDRDREITFEVGDNLFDGVVGVDGEVFVENQRFSDPEEALASLVEEHGETPENSPEAEQLGVNLRETGENFPQFREGRDLVGSEEETEEVLIVVPRLEERGPNAFYRVDPFVNDAHYKTENVVVHSRLTYVKNGDGSTTMLVDEVQSDLSSDWRNFAGGWQNLRPYADESEVTAVKRSLDEEDAAIDREQRALETEDISSAERRRRELSLTNKQRKLATRRQLHEARESIFRSGGDALAARREAAKSDLAGAQRRYDDSLARLQDEQRRVFEGFGSAAFENAEQADLFDIPEVDRVRLTSAFANEIQTFDNLQQERVRETVAPRAFREATTLRAVLDKFAAEGTKEDFDALVRARRDTDNAREALEAAQRAAQNLDSATTEKAELPERRAGSPFDDQTSITLMMKRLMQRAAERGDVSKIAWTPAYVQARRWSSNAAAVIEEVTWDNTGRRRATRDELRPEQRRWVDAVQARVEESLANREALGFEAVDPERVPDLVDAGVSMHALGADDPAVFDSLRDLPDIERDLVSAVRSVASELAREFTAGGEPLTVMPFADAEQRAGPLVLGALIPAPPRTAELRTTHGRGFVSFDEDGTIRNAEGSRPFGREMVGKPLSEVVGGPLAEQMLTESTGRVPGQQIVVGGEGYKNVYDRQIRKFMEKFVKPFNGKVTLDDTLTEASGPSNERASEEVIRDTGVIAFAEAAERAGLDLGPVSAANIRQSFSIVGGFDEAGHPTEATEAAARVVNDLADRLRRRPGVVEFAKSLDPKRFERTTNPLWSVTITPEMREASKQPMALFQRAPGAPRGSIMLPPPGGTDPASVINLFDNADMSTALHELGHFHLFTLQTLVQNGTATPRMVRQWNTLNAWWLDNADQIAVEGGIEKDQVDLYLRRGATGDQEIDRKVQVGIHELFARGFETYLLEGKAPSKRLRQAFDAFAAWLAEVYKQVKGSLGVTLTDEVREVFDQLLATEEELSVARTGQGGADAEVLSLGADTLAADAADRGRLRQLSEEAITEARANALADIMAPLRRERTKEGQRLKKEIKERVSNEVHSKRVNRVREWLGNGRWVETFPGDQPSAALPQEVRLSRRLLVEQYGPDILNRLPRGRRPIFGDEKTIDPDELASLFGYGSGDEMIRDLVRSPAPDREIAQRTRDELRDALSTEEDVEAEQAATDALRNDKRAELYRAEVAALRKIGARGSVTPARVMKATARATISRMRLRTAVKHGQFQAAERRAGEAAQKALAAGDFEAALEAKRDQLINLELYRASREAAELSRKLQNTARRLQRRSTQQKIDAVQNDAIAAVLTNYDFRAVSQAAEDHRVALKRYMEAMDEQNRAGEVSIPKSVLDQAQRLPFQRMTVEQAQDVLDTLTNLEHTGRLKREIKVGQEKRQRAEVAKEIAAGVVANFRRPRRSRSPQQNRTLAASAREFLSLAVNAETLTRRIDGGNPRGTTTLALKDAIDKGSVQEVQMREQASRDVEALYSVYSGAERRRMTRREFHPEVGESLSKWDVISIALNTGNEGNLRRLTDPQAMRPISESQLESLLDRTMTKKDWEFVQSVWRYIDSFWPAIAERERRVTGVAPEKVEPRTVRTRFGDIEGGYYPIVYDSELSAKELVEGSDELAQALMAGQFTKAQTKQNHLKDRAAGGGGRTVQLGMQVLHTHVHTLIHDLALNEAVTDAWKLLQDENLRSGFLSANAGDELRALELWVLDVAAGQSMTAGWLSRMARHARNGFTFSKLGFNMATTAIQVTGLAQSAVVVGKKNLVLGISDHLRRGILPSAEDVKSVSPFMRDRELTFHRDIFDMLGETATGPTTSVARKSQKLLLQTGLAGITKMQFYAVDVPTWLGAYRDGMRRFDNDEQAARDFADRQVARAQASGLFSDRTAIERGTAGRTFRQSEFLRLFTALGSYMFAKGNVALERSARLRREVSGLNLRSAAAVTSAATDFALLFTVEAVLYSAIRGFLPEDDDDESWAEFLAKETALAAASTLPFVRDFASAAQGFNGGGAFGTVTETFQRLIEQITQGEFDSALVRSVSDMSGIAFPGIPSTELNRLFFSPDAEGVVEHLLGVPRQ